MKKKLTLILCFAVLSGMLSCKRGEQSFGDMKLTLYSDSLHGFELLVPKKWIFVPPVSEGNVASFRPEKSAENDPFFILVGTGALPPSFSSKEYAAGIESVLNGIVKKYKRLDSYSRVIDDREVWILVYEGTFLDTAFRKYQAFIETNGTGYHVIVSFPQKGFSGNERGFADAVINSFKLTPVMKK